jgi:flagellar basal body-associated protein FliL
MEPEKKSNGALIGLIIIILLLVIGGIYVWQSNKDALQETDSTVVTEEDSTELDSLEASLETTDTNIGVDVETIE